MGQGQVEEIGRLPRGPGLWSNFPVPGASRIRWPGRTLIASPTPLCSDARNTRALEVQSACFTGCQGILTSLSDGVGEQGVAKQGTGVQTDIGQFGSHLLLSHSSCLCYDLGIMVSYVWTVGLK